MRDATIRTANAVRKQRYAGAVAVFAAGSLVRGEGTAFSDLDLVVVYDAVPNAYRESFRFAGLPVEAFVHDPETLHYFFVEVDRPTGVPSLARMVQEGVEIPDGNVLSRSLRTLAISVIEGGPPVLTDEGDRTSRYNITDLVDDIRAPRSYEELIATGGRLYETLADYYLRANGQWSARGKTIPRELERVAPDLAARYRASFERLFKCGDPSDVIALSEALLNQRGGLVFEGHRRAAAPQWRKAL